MLQFMKLSILSDNMNMRNRKIILFAAISMTVALVCGCKEEKKSHVIIAKKPKVEAPKAPQKMGDYEHTGRVTWMGNTYTVETTLTACDSLPLIDEGSVKYYDNTVLLRIVRANGTVFYSHTFTKKDFNSCLDERMRKNGALLGVVYVKADSDYLYFATSVGSPDKSSDDYIPLVLKVHRLGSIAVTRDTTLDTEE